MNFAILSASIRFDSLMLERFRISVHYYTILVLSIPQIDFFHNRSSTKNCLAWRWILSAGRAVSKVVFEEGFGTVDETADRMRGRRGADAGRGLHGKLMG